MSILNRFLKANEGQDLIEYAILLGLIMVAAFASVSTVGNWVARVFSTIAGLA